MIVRIMQFLLILLVSPLLFGIINRTKAFFAGRKGSPLLQLYFDIFKLFRKGAVYSTTTTWIFIFGPVISLAALVTASAIIPFAGYASFFSFEGDLIFFVYLLGLARFFMVLAALDTGSSFEGMGASREVQFALFAEPALFLCLAALSHVTGKMSLAQIFSHLDVESWSSGGRALVLVIGSLFIVFLAENSRIPVDDPNTHLELTMIHEVMVLDHGGPDFAFIMLGASVKFWILGALLTGIVTRIFSFGVMFDIIIFILAMIFLAVIVGIVESVLARVRLLKVPHLLMAALALSIIALTVTG